jgi:O-antigen ligase
MEVREVSDPVQPDRDLHMSHDRVDVPGFARLAGVLVVAYVVASRLVEDVYTLPVGVSLHISDVILAALLGVVFLWIMAEPLLFPSGFVSLLGAALLVAILVMPYLNAPGMTEFEASGAERGLVRATLLAGLFVASYRLALSLRWAYRILFVILGMTLFQAVLAVSETITGKPAAFLGTMWQAIGFEIDPRATRGAVIALQERLTGELRASATAPHPLVLVGLLAIGIGICLAFFLYSESRRARTFYLAAITFQFLAIGATNQRTAFVALAAMAAVIALTQIQKLPTALSLVLAVVLGGIAVAVFSPNTPRLILNFATGQASDHNAAVRASKYVLLPDLIERRPLLGAGYSTSDPSRVIFDNGYLTELVELGIIGLSLLLAFLLVVAFRSSGSLSRSQVADQPVLLTAVLAATVLFSTMTTFDVLSFEQLFPTALIVMAVGLARADTERRIRPPDSRDS